MRKNLDVDLIVQLYRTESIEGVARKLGTSGRAVALRLREAGIHIRPTHKGINLGANNRQWKGEAVKYKGIHEWVRRHLPKPTLCPDCMASAPRDLANISQEYKRDLGDWEWLCRKCHMVKDGRLDRLIERNQRGLVSE